MHVWVRPLGASIVRSRSNWWFDCLRFRRGVYNGECMKRRRLSMKFRLAIVIPALVIMLGLAALAIAQPDLARLLTVGIPLVGITALASGFVLERSSRHLGMQTEGPLSPRGARLRKLRLAVLMAGSVFIIGMTVLAITQPPGALPLLLSLTVVGALIAALIAIFLERRER